MTIHVDHITCITWLPPLEVSQGVTLENAGTEGQNNNWFSP